LRQGYSNSRQKKLKSPPNGAKEYSPGEGSPGRGDAPLGKKEIAGITDKVKDFDDKIKKKLVN
jgi:hypothetical protein